MKYSLINVVAERDGCIQGSWIQDVIGTIEDAKARAVEIVEANGGKIKVAIVEDIPSTRPDLYCPSNLRGIL